MNQGDFNNKLLKTIFHEIENHKFQEIELAFGNKILGKYIVFETTLEFLNEISKSEDEYHIFETKYIESFFYDLMGDYRWNLYVVFVLNDFEIRNLAWEKKMIIERGRNFARKLILSSTEYKNLFSNKNNEEKVNQTIEYDPIRDWITILNNNNLLFCKDEFSSNQLNMFLRSDKKIIPSKIVKEKNINESTQKKLSNLHVSSIMFGTKYREHCFEPSTEINFSLVNLIYGPNGSGKTSILEAIELALTGSVQREQLIKTNTIQSSWDGNIKFNNNNSFIGLPSNSEKKTRESIFYENKEKSIDKLNRAFHQYNYFSTEEVYQFCFTAEGQPDYENEFQKIIFGEEVKTIEKHINRYKKEFSDKITNIENEIESQEKQVQVLLEIIGNKISDISLTTIIKLLTKLNLKNNLFLLELQNNNELYRIEHLGSILNNINDFLVDFDEYISDITDMTLKGIYNFQELEHKKDHTEKNVSELKTTLKKIKVEYSKLNNEINNSSKDLKELSEVIEFNEASLYKVNDQIQFINKNLSLLNNFDKVEKRIALEDEIDRTRLKYNIHHHFVNNYNFMEDFNISKLDLIENNKRKYVLEDELKHLRLEYEETQILISHENSKKSNLKEQMEKLKILGQTLVEATPDTINCPLCGTKHNSHDELIKRIFSELDESQLAFDLELKRKEIKLLNDIEKKILAIDKLERDFELIKNITASFDYIKKNGIAEEEYLKARINHIKNYESVFKIFQHNTEELLIKMNRLVFDRNLLESDGYNLESVVNLKENMINRLNIDTSDLNNINEFLQKLNLGKSDLTAILQESESKVKKKYSGIDLLKENISNILDTEIKHKLMMENYEEQLKVFDKWFASKVGLSVIISKNININNLNLSTWYQTVISLKEEIFRLQHTVNEHKSYLEVNQKLSDEEGKLIENKNLLKICKKAKTTIDNLKNLSEYSVNFLQSNIRAISDKFISLHSPREFSALILNKERKLIVLREDNNGGVQEIPIHLMSTGQRTAVALSVFFVLHKSMPNAPKFLLLDEPVANMDDLNVLSFLDLLRELSINGIQLFISTANPNIAKLIRRKFSSLENEFKSINLSRTVDKKIHGEIFYYSPQLDEPVKVEVI